MRRGLLLAILLAGLSGAAGCLAPNDFPTILPNVCDANRTTCDPVPGAVVGPLVPGEIDNATLGALPSWQVGDWWTFKATDGSSITAVVVAAGGTYEVRSTDNATAALDALYDFSTLGTIHADLSGDQRGNRVRFFDWPLEDGKTWSLTLDGRALRATARLVGQEWRIEAVEGNQTVVSYTYSPVSKWFTNIRWELDEFGLNLVKGGNGFVGDVIIATLTERYSYTTGAVPASTFNVNQGASGVLVTYGFECRQGFAASARFVDNKGTARQLFSDVACTGPNRGGDNLAFPAIPGPWTAQVTSAGDGRLDVRAYEVTETKRQVSAAG